MSKAQQNENYIAKLKATGKYGDYKDNRAAKTRLYRQKKKDEEKKMSLKEKANAVQKRREATLQRVRKQNQTEVKENSSSLSQVSPQGYNCVQTLSKAVKKSERAFPKSPTKKKAVLARIFSNMSEADKIDFNTAILPTKPKTKTFPNVLMLAKDVRDFYERDDISRVSPKMRDVKEYRCAETGEKILLPTRHMILTCKEAYALFKEEQNKSGKGKF